MSASSESPPDAPAGPRLSRGRRLLFSGVIFLTFVVLQEILFRWLFPLPEFVSFNRIDYTPLLLFGDTLGEKRPGGLSNVKLRWESEPDGFAFDHSLNLYGFRGPDFKLDASPELPRIVFVGDSFAEGAGAADDDTIPEQFRTILRDQGRPVETINLGVNGTGFPEYALLARDGLALLKPNTLFLIVCFNDLPALPMLEKAKKPAPDFPRQNRWVPRALAAIDRKLDGRTIAARYTSAPIPFVSPVPSPTNPLTNQKPPPTLDPEILSAMKRGTANPWNFVLAGLHERMLRHDFERSGGGAEEYLRHLAKLCQQDKTQLIVVFIPHSVTTNPVYMQAQIKLGAPSYGSVTRLDGPEYRSAQRHLRQATKDLGIPFLDTTDEFILAEQTRGRMFWPIDGHCNAAGYRLVAEICTRYWLDGTLPHAPE
jgi:lysophospholipase L1-like esterase